MSLQHGESSCRLPNSAAHSVANSGDSPRSGNNNFNHDEFFGSGDNDYVGELIEFNVISVFILEVLCVYSNSDSLSLDNDFFGARDDGFHRHDFVGASDDGESRTT